MVNDLLPGRLPLLVLQPAFEHARGSVRRSCSSRVHAELVAAVRASISGRRTVLTSLTVKVALHRLAAQSRVGDRRRTA